MARIRARPGGRIDDLHERVHRGAYRAQPSKRAWIPKADGRQRPLGIAALENKIVQQAVKTVLEQIYEGDFLGFSYGFRPWRSCHNALDALYVGIEHRKVNWVLDADIRGFFDNIDHEWMLKFLKHRIADKRILRLIQKWLTAGASEDGQWSRTTVGTPQGSVISPLLANVFLHYVFDLWANQWRERHAQIGNHRPLRRRLCHGLPIASGCRTVPARYASAWSSSVSSYTQKRPGLSSSDATRPNDVGSGARASRRRSTFSDSRIVAERRGREPSRSNVNRSPSGYGPSCKKSNSSSSSVCTAR